MSLNKDSLLVLLLSNNDASSTFLIMYDYSLEGSVKYNGWMLTVLLKHKIQKLIIHTQFTLPDVHEDYNSYF